MGERQDPTNIQRREVPEEALQALAREVAREVGLAQDPNDTALLPNDKPSAELFRTLAFLNVGLLTGRVATVAFLPEPRHIWWPSLWVGTNALSISLALLGLWYATRVVGQGEERRRLRPFREISMLGTVLSFGEGLAAFDVFALLNLGPLS